MSNAKDIIAEIDKLEDIYLSCKSFFPALNNSLIGRTNFETADYYKFRGYRVMINTDKEITKEFINKYAEIGKWLNENVIIRLYGILHYHKLVGNTEIDYKSPGAAHVRFCCWIRNVVTKTHLEYKPSKKDNIDLIREIISYYHLKPDDFPAGYIPTPVHKVIQPLFEGCREYVRAKYGQARND